MMSVAHINPISAIKSIKNEDILMAMLRNSYFVLGIRSNKIPAKKPI